MAVIQQLLQEAMEELTRSGSETAQLDAELLLASTLGQSRTWLHTWPEHPLEREEEQQFSQLLHRRAAGEPVAHLLGRQEFWSLELKTTPDTLIPRPETELLVELALQWIPENLPWRIADLGTGSGAIAIAIATERPLCTVVATDRSPAALAVARENRSSHNITNLEFREGSWLEPLDGERFQMILSNPPYIALNDPYLEQGDLRHEPRSALTSGVEGLDDITFLAAHAGSSLLPGGILVVEHGYDQGKQVRSLFRQNHFSGVETRQDLAGQERITYGTRQR